MLLRMLRGPRTGGGPGPLARLIAMLVVLGLLAISAPPLVALARWVLSLL